VPEAGIISPPSVAQRDIEVAIGAKPDLPPIVILGGLVDLE
jgi:hypothetical protein